MTASGYDGARALARLAERLDGPRGALPALFALTDPERTPDPAALAKRLPPGSGLILRTFGRPALEAQAFELAALCRSGGVTFLVAADPALALRCGADGVHWPQRWLSGAAVRRSSGLVTASAHSPAAVHQAQALVDAVFVSPVFASKSPSAGWPLGPMRASAFARSSTGPVYALGGVSATTIKRLYGLGFSGVGAVGAV